MIRTASILFLALAAAPAGALAQSRWYAGITGGLAKTADDLVENRERTIFNATIVGTDFDDRDAAWKGFVGVRLNSVFALELGYADLGSHRMVTHARTLGSDASPGSIAINRKITGYGIDLVASPPLDHACLSIFGKAGSFRTRLEADATLDGAFVFSPGDPNERSRTTVHREYVFRWGVGAQWVFTPHLSGRIEFERYSNVGKAFAIGGMGTTGEADTDVFSAGVVYRF